MKFNILYKYCLLLLLTAGAIWLSSCNTKKNTFTRRVYHNLTTHFNVYWNGNESYKNGLSDLASATVDNYNLILPVYNFGTADNARKIYSPMDKAIEKAGLAIQRHSLFFHNVEYNRWIDDCYMLIGKSQFYKQDYVSARRTFEYIIKQYPGTPISYEASIFMVRSFLQQKRFDDATGQLDQMETRMAKNSIPYKIRREIPLLYADYYILNGNYTAAKPHLKQGIELASSLLMKARLNFILGQIAQKEKDYAAATLYYSKVIKSPAPFEMAFNARINLARSFDIASGDKGGLVKQLKHMLKDSKNRDYKDQIYYALAYLAKLDKNDTLVIHYLRLSVTSSTKNNFQKSTSALELADLYFSKQDYERASSYYDTTAQTIPKEHPDYLAILQKTQTLSELVSNLEVVQYEDSLQRLAHLPEKELKAIIQKKIDEVVEEEKKRKEEEAMQQNEANMLNAVIPNMRNENMSAVGGGGWYFYNPSAISFGYSEFMRKWGRRKLEDNWRLSNKRSVAQLDEMASGDKLGTADSTMAKDSTAGKPRIRDPKNPESYMQKIHLTKAGMDKSNAKIAEALLNLGYIYKDDLHDMPRSIATFEDYATRFPEKKDIVRIYYQLYLMGVQIPDDAIATKYKNIILDKFGETDYAQIIRDPDYNKEVLAKRNRASSLYEETYQAYTRGQYKLVLLYSNQAISEFKDRDLLPRFDFLKAMSLGKTIGIDTLVMSLKKLVEKYPNHEVTPIAQEIILKYAKKTTSSAVSMQGDSAALAKTRLLPLSAVTDTLVPDIYKANPEQTHFYLMMADESTVNITAVKNRISDFITKNFGNLGLTVNSIVLDGGWQLITVSSFKNAKSAMDFYRTIGPDDYVMAKIDQNDIRQMVISMDNYPVFYR